MWPQPFERGYIAETPGPSKLSQICLHVLSFSFPHIMFSLWLRYGQSHFLKKLVVCKCVPFPRPSPHSLSLLPRWFP